MAIDRNDSEERQARLDVMIEEFRTAQRRLVQRHIVVRKRAEADGQGNACVVRPLPVDRAH